MPEMQSQEKVRAARKQMIARILAHVKQVGYAEVSPLISSGLDDPPESPLEEWVRIGEEVNAAKEGRRLHLEAPRTFLGELERVCREEGLPFFQDPMTRYYRVILPQSAGICLACKGHGKTLAPQPVARTMEEVLACPPTVQLLNCRYCNGSGKARRGNLMGEPEELKTSAEWYPRWQEETGLEIMDPDGWRPPNPPCDWEKTPLSYEEFKRRAAWCTVQGIPKQEAGW